MKKKLIALPVAIALFFIVFLYAYKHFSQTSNPSQIQQDNYAVQLIWQCPGVMLLRKAIVPIADKIIHEELGLDNTGIDKKETLFLGKDRQPLSLYYLLDMQELGEQTLIITYNKVVQSRTSVPQETSITDTIDFFGENHDELVILVQDPAEELQQLNSIMKNMAHTADSIYKNTNKNPLFNITKSEQFNFVPHIGLGRIRSASIKRYSKDAGQTLERIKTRIKEATLAIIHNSLTPENKKIFYTSLVICNLSKRENIIEYALGDAQKNN